MTAPALLTEDEAAAALRVCPRTLRKERQAGRLPYILIGRRVLYAPSDLETYVERARTTARPAADVMPRGRRVASNRLSGAIIPFSKRGSGR
jgi:excisionase family DNA binding protein